VRVQIQRRSRRAACRLSAIACTAIAIGVLSGGCPLAIDTAGSDTDDGPAQPLFIDNMRALGIWQALADASAVLPEFLLEEPAVDGEDPFEVELVADVAFKETPQRTLRLNVHRPRTDDDQLRRAIVLYMGGNALYDDDFEIMEVWAAYLASRGFVVFNSRQRLLTEDGVTQVDVLSDALAAVRFVVAEGPEYGADPERIGVVGRSSGGPLALLMGMLPDPELFRQPGDPDAPVQVGAMVDIAGPTDAARIALGIDFSIITREEYVQAYGGLPTEQPFNYALLSPMTYVRSGLPPTLIIHGAIDTTVPITQGIDLAVRLAAAGNTVETLFPPDTGHVVGWGMFNNDGFGNAMTRIIDFFERHL
jgi:acetyl esterase/lipase